MAVRLRTLPRSSLHASPELTTRRRAALDEGPVQILTSILVSDRCGKLSTFSGQISVMLGGPS